MFIPFVKKKKSAFLHPTVEVGSRDRIRIMKYSILRRQNIDRSLFHRNPRPAQLRGVRSKVSAIKVTDAGVVLHDQRSAALNKIEQLLVISSYFFLRVIRSNSKNDCSVPA